MRGHDDIEVTIVLLVELPDGPSTLFLILSECILVDDHEVDVVTLQDSH
jgi:hypothetical protein